ncbi:sulfatase-like hydrolase/transferase [Parahaliea aestuarii]|uniref:sulfatase-like hydrolase/transferase n=1 Tax=Parahaliea aestuarii TaxID=1852021 RepID=UPI0016500F2A|nr:sulfatase-like hydrolase/transferase [Parahaliea aestuarii]
MFATSTSRGPVGCGVNAPGWWVLLLLLAIPAQAQTPPGLPPPNIVLIVVDDIGYSDFGAFGGEIDTPNIDALAGAGVRFSNFHTASSCAPTRAMLLTGVDHHSAGIGNMRESVPFSHRGKPGYGGVLNDRVTTVATQLQDAGYRTAIAGKWHLGHEPRNLPPARGFDDSLIQADNGADNYEMRPYLPLKSEAYWYDNGQRLAALPPDFYSSTAFVDRTIAFLEAGRDQESPFFAYLAFQANHAPLQAPAEFIERYRGRYTEGWARARDRRIDRLAELGLLPAGATAAAGPGQQDWDRLSPEQQVFEARRMQVYAGMATAMDHEIGRLLDYLRDSGDYGNTVFVVLSDNGATVAEPYESRFVRAWLDRHYSRAVETLGIRGSWVAAGRGWGAVSNTPLAGAKFSASEGGVRVPLIIAGTGVVPRGGIDREFAYITDLAPTLLALAGVSSLSNQPLDGASLVPRLGGPDSVESAATPTGAAPTGAAPTGAAPTGYEFAGHSALYRAPYKLVRNRPPLGDGEWRLFHIGDDPGETRNLATELPQVFAQLQADYAAYVQRVGVLPVPENYVFEKQAALNALVFVWLPRYLPVLLLVLAAVLLVFVWLRRRRRRRD